MAEWISEDALVREKIRQQFKKSAFGESKVKRGKKEEGEKYKNYFDFKEAVSKIASHRALALFRAEKEGFIRVKIEPNREYTFQWLERFLCKNNN